jgi:hypothetical protein
MSDVEEGNLLLKTIIHKDIRVPATIGIHEPMGWLGLKKETKMEDLYLISTEYCFGEVRTTSSW